MNKDETLQPAETNHALLGKQRSHILLILGGPREGGEAVYLKWCLGEYHAALATMPGVLRISHYAQHEIDITQGHFNRPPFQYLGLCEISVDGAPAAQSLIENIHSLHEQQSAALAPATWLYYPASEKAGRARASLSSTMVVAFANGIVGQEAEFNEFYATCHIRHALNINVLVNGQTFHRTQFQLPGAMKVPFDTVAIYEQDGTAEEFIASANALADIQFPTLDLSRFAESAYRLL